MRLVAFSFLLTAAFDWPVFFLDRAGVALLGLAFAALAIPSRRRARESAATPAADGMMPFGALAPDEAMAAYLRGVEVGE